MNIKVYADRDNSKTILTLLEEMGYSLPCNCQGARLCNGSQYSFDCAMVPHSPVSVSLPGQTDGLQGVSLEKFRQIPGNGDTLLIDLGTTTIALALISSDSGALRRTMVFANPQKTYGADVISRIRLSVQGSGGVLREVLQSALIHQTRKLCSQNGQDTKDIHRCFIAGNTTMIHLLMGYDCHPLAGSPFAIQQISPPPFFHHGCEVCILPWITAFIGGDITAGLYACSMDTGEKTSLLIDLGTNGEMVLRHKGVLYAASTAAGPAFEGGGISCGCPGVPGAISRVQLKRLRPTLETIDNKLPIGICGSGAVSVCAELLRHGFMDTDGILTDQFPPEGILLGHRTDGTPLIFSADDLRALQLSVAAIAAGIDTLTDSAGVAPEDIDTVYLGGGFGFYLDMSDCQTLGMFSAIPPDNIIPVGNTSLKGLYLLATSDTSLPTVPSVEFINLAESSYFQKQFVSHMTYDDKNHSV